MAQFVFRCGASLSGFRGGRTQISKGGPREISPKYFKKSNLFIFSIQLFFHILNPMTQFVFRCGASLSGFRGSRNHISKARASEISSLHYALSILFIFSL